MSTGMGPGTHLDHWVLNSTRDDESLHRDPDDGAHPRRDSLISPPGDDPARPHRRDRGGPRRAAHLPARHAEPAGLERHRRRRHGGVRPRARARDEPRRRRRRPPPRVRGRRRRADPAARGVRRAHEARGLHRHLGPDRAARRPEGRRRRHRAQGGRPARAARRPGRGHPRRAVPEPEPGLGDVRRRRGRGRRRRRRCGGGRLLPLWSDAY